MALGPVPLQDLKKLPMSYQLWFNQVKQFVGGGVGAIPWTSVDKAGSNLTDLAVRNHNNLQTIQGGQLTEYYHLTAVQHTNATALATLTTNTTLNNLVHGRVLVNASGGAVTLTLSAASTRTWYHIKKIDSSVNAVTIQRAGSDVIEGVTSTSLPAQYDSITLYSDGSGTWYVESTT